ncbi:MAG: NAD-dependent epimerase/dehydratase family protein [Planctomycetes bacterium]|nr:NAD-dependent epimerase/dehydratase family protein [Planctomycetota bacterium]
MAVATTESHADFVIDADRLLDGRSFWRLEGSLVSRGAIREVAFLAINCQTFFGRWTRLLGLGMLAPISVLISLIHQGWSQRIFFLVLRGISRDRLDVLGDEYFEYVLRPRLRADGVIKLKSRLIESPDLVLVSSGFEHAVRPLARYLNIQSVLANRLDFRDGFATGRLLRPVIKPRTWYGRLTGHLRDAVFDVAALRQQLSGAVPDRAVMRAILPAERPPVAKRKSCIVFDDDTSLEPLRVRETLQGKHILLAGVTGFIGKVWLENILSDIPEVGRIYLLIRKTRTRSATERFEKVVAESPVFAAIYERHGDEAAKFISDRVEVIEGDVCEENLGLAPEIAQRLRQRLDLFVNSTGLTDFTPDIRTAIDVNVDGPLNILEFVRGCERASLMHLSTCFVVGQGDGRVPEVLRKDYTPRGLKDFSAEKLYADIKERVALVEKEAESEARTAIFTKAAEARNSGNPLAERALKKQLHKARVRWTRRRLTERGVRLARKYNWPNTYCLSKSLAESLIANRRGDVRLSIVRPAIVETSVRRPFEGWNEGVNTAAPLAHLLGTYFRQLPSNKRKALDIIPVDMVCRGMTLVAAALVSNRHHDVYQLGTSGDNPFEVGRTVELTGLAHRIHNRRQHGFKYRFRSQFDAITVSKTRYVAMSAPSQKAIVGIGKRIAKTLGFNESPLAKAERGLNRTEKLIELFEPFILKNQQFFETSNIRALSYALDETEASLFACDIESIDWWHYCLNVHMPGLRRWVFPLIEGKSPEQEEPRPFHMPSANRGSLAGTKVSSSSGGSNSGGSSPDSSASGDANSASGGPITPCPSS